MVGGLPQRQLWLNKGVGSAMASDEITEIVGTDPSGSIGLVGTWHRAMEIKSLYSKLHPSLYLPCARFSAGQSIFLIHHKLGLRS